MTTRNAFRWMWLPVAAAVACGVFVSLDRLTRRRYEAAQPSFKVSVVEKTPRPFVPPRVSPQKAKTVHVEAPPVMAPPNPPGSLYLPALMKRRKIRHSFDGGKTSRTINLPEELEGTIASIGSQAANQVTIESSTGQRWSTTDGGLDWTRQR